MPTTIGILGIYLVFRKRFHIYFAEFYSNSLEPLRNGIVLTVQASEKLLRSVVYPFYAADSGRTGTFRARAAPNISAVTVLRAYEESHLGH